MRYRILGATEAQDEHGQNVPLGGPRLRALLTALAARADRHTPVTPTTLIDEIWPEDPPHDAPAALQALIGRLRRTIGRDAVASEPGGYRLTVDAPHDIDLFAFEQRLATGTRQLDDGDPDTAAETLRTALALWRGPALADLPDRESAAAGPNAQHLTARRTRIEADLRRGATAHLPAELTALIETHPYDEPLHAQLIRALRAEGRTADALLAYESARRTLADALGADPGPELAALHQELLNPVPQEAAGNLRPRLTSFVGREPELEAIRQDLAAHRLVTLTGPGGSGKTRLAEESVAHTPAWLVELAPLDHPDAVPGAVVSALGLRETTLLGRDGQPHQDDPVARLVDHFAAAPTLLVLDNCEHVIDAAARLAETLLTRCPALRILATSREPLGVPGERVRPVEPLPPDPAHRLFAERARTVRPDFDPADDPEAIDEICRRLDGLPLAIELAAARLRLLGPRQIADRLDDRFRLLTSGSRTVLPRQQTLRAVVDWSWDLLDERERAVLRRASVFAGGWDLAAAQAVCGSTDDLAALVDKSLVVAAPDPDTGGMRYRMLETIHEYAAERAAETPRLLDEAARAHTAYYRELAQEADPLLRSRDQLVWIRRVERELDNIRAALHRVTTTAPDPAEAREIALVMGWFWWLRNYRGEGVAWVDRVLGLEDGAEPGPDDPRYWPCMRLGLLRIFLLEESGRADRLRTPEILAEMERLRDAFAGGGPEAARFPGLLWPFAVFLTHTAGQVRDSVDAVVANCRTYGGEWEVGVSLMFRTHMVIDMPGGVWDVDADLAELRELGRRVGDRWMRAQVAGAAGEAAMMRGLPARALPEYEEALGLAREVGAHAEAPFLLSRLAELTYRAGDLEGAAKVLDEAAAEAARYNVYDTAAYIHYLRACMALDTGDTATARAECDAATMETARSTPPPHFTAILQGLQARVAAAESGPEIGVRGLAKALRTAIAADCAEILLAHFAEGAAQLLPELGEAGMAVRVLAAAETWRAGIPLWIPDRTALENLRTRLRAELGAERYEEERAEGAGLSTGEVAELLEGAFAP
ncbi:BTAD domain-containing putative transcriptional regulator [Streptomyces melanogenes]|uniref:BTAD domain-containing putative transcriptional regulator n=1 Tax=Streptomyces melanogenes TaxID=67326 RepID=UPI00167EA8E3|nr:BTAD domain-containing putative transcriptional regulator [Streptomyces melanogenes]GGP84801.1 AfsR family transcriptional regulator [Streptomyces melanogenes]